MRARKAVHLYRFFHAGEPAGEGRLEVMPGREGVKATFQAELLLPLPRTKVRLSTETDLEGFSRYFSERVEGREARVFTVERLEGEGLVMVSQGKESLAYPYLAPYHDALSLLLALPHLDLLPGEVARFALPGGRAYVERLPDLEAEGRPLRQYRLRPGLTLVQVEGDRVVRVAQQVGDHVFEALWEGEEEPRRRRRWV
ncbi:hypothetical protein YIM1640_04820 [Thermus oshimai]